MAKPKTTCPRCGNPNARPNARGPNHVYCKRCGGLVPVDDHATEFGNMVHADPVRNAIEREEGAEERGRVKRHSGRPLKGGLE